MAFFVGQEVIYTSVGGKKEKATILRRKEDYKESGQIDTFNIKGGGFEYQISVKRNGITTEVFCLEKELS